MANRQPVPPSTTAPRGCSCFPDAAAAEAKGISPDDVVGVVAPAVACALVVQAGLGGLHVEAGTADEAWAAVSRERCATLVAG